MSAYGPLGFPHVAVKDRRHTNPILEGLLYKFPEASPAASSKTTTHHRKHSTDSSSSDDASILSRHSLSATIKAKFRKSISHN